MPTTRGFRALTFDFALATDHDALRDHFEWLFADFGAAHDPPGTHVVGVTERDGRTVVQLREGGDGDVVAEGLDGPAFVGQVVQWVNQRATRADGLVSCHAGGVARGGAACVLPAHTESGKTTLTTGLVRGGCAYVTDEAVAFDPDGTIRAYPKPLSLDPGSQHLFPELVPPLPPGLPAPDPSDGPHQWHVPVSAVRADAVADDCRARLVVFPRYDGAATTGLRPMTRAEGLVELAKNTFHFSEASRRSLDRLADVVRGAECHRLVVGDLDSACAVVDELLANRA